MIRSERAFAIVVSLLLHALLFMLNPDLPLSGRGEGDRLAVTVVSMGAGGSGTAALDDVPAPEPEPAAGVDALPRGVPPLLHAPETPTQQPDLMQADEAAPPPAETKVPEAQQPPHEPKPVAIGTGGQEQPQQRQAASPPSTKAGSEPDPTHLLRRPPAEQEVTRPLREEDDRAIPGSGMAGTASGASETGGIEEAGEASDSSVASGAGRVTAEAGEAEQVAPVSPAPPVAEDQPEVSALPLYHLIPKPPYPKRSRELGEQGRVIVAILVSAEGEVTQAYVETSSGHPLLDGSALATVIEKWRFQPARHQGRPVATWVRVPIDFKIAER